MLLHQGNIGKVRVAFLWIIWKPGWFATMYYRWNKTAHKKCSYELFYQGVCHPMLWMHRMWQLPKVSNDNEISQGNQSQEFLTKAIFTYFVEVSDYSDRNCLQLFEAPPEPQLYGLPKKKQKYLFTISLIAPLSQRLHSLSRWHMKDNQHIYIFDQYIFP